MRIQDIDIAEPIKKLLGEMGYHDTYPPQEMAIEAGAIEGKNLVLASPTASGKTLIAFIAAAKHVFEGSGKVIYLVPLRALASEKYAEFRALENIRKGNGERIRVRVSTGDYDTSGRQLRRADVIIATNEKMDSLLRHSPPWLREVSLVVADEIHLIHYPDRGPTLEVLITRVLRDLPVAQFLALSATITNTEEFSKWLGAEVVSTPWRPVPLKEGIYLDEAIFFNDGDSKPVPDKTGRPHIDIALRTVEEGGQAIIFTRTRREAVANARRASVALRKSYRDMSSESSPVDFNELHAVAQRIRTRGEQTSLSETIAKMIEGGASFHHAGISSTQRRIIEEAFKKGRIKILTATPTLAAGVNLPARTVVLTYYERYRLGYSEPISVFEYKQFAGRAGRPQYDQFGESVLIARDQRIFDFLHDLYITGQPERITSKLGEGESLDMHMLGLVANRKRIKFDNIIDFFQDTLFALQQQSRQVLGKIRTSLRTLETGRLAQKLEPFYTPTPFGALVAQLYILPSTSVKLREGLESINTRQVSPLGYLHLICTTADMLRFPLYKRDRAVLQTQLEETEENLIIRPPAQSHLFSYSYLDYLQEFKTALTLHDWVSEVSENTIFDRHRVQPGDLHAAAYTGEWLLYAASRLANLLRRTGPADDLIVLSKRMKYGIKPQLLELVTLEGVGRVRARNLYSAGYKTLGDVSRASLGNLEKIPTIGPRIARNIKEALAKTRGA